MIMVISIDYWSRSFLFIYTHIDIPFMSATTPKGPNIITGLGLSERLTHTRRELITMPEHRSSDKHDTLLAC